MELRGHSQLGGGGTTDEAHGGAGGGGSAQLLRLDGSLLWLLEGGTLDSLLVGEGLELRRSTSSESCEWSIPKWLSLTWLRSSLGLT